ncbi:hypothetical protein [Nocardioides acrostichi]|uniref:Uncharacterized protein n=1 Tax=Nocardioides acrostichi TaxID=2784339 RepID=A0A930V1M7_9ACTN|nr:hypothetical protein [Nocardioides acrostichi]MBF4162389.1 hypothetical protein [Nocardioides acrostichi]
MTTVTAPAPALARTLAYDAQDPHPLVARVARELGYADRVGTVVGLSSAREVLLTAGTAHDVDGLVRVGDVHQPRRRLLRALMDAPSALSVVAAVTVPWPWVWCTPEGFDAGPVRVRKTAYGDLAGYFTAEGIDCELVSDYLTATEMLAGLGERSVVLDADEVPAGLTRTRGVGDQAHPLSYGLISRLPAAEPDYCWLGLQPDADRPGSLNASLARLAAREVDLDFLFSDSVADRAHRFFLGFRADADTAAAVVADLRAEGSEVRVLGSFTLPDDEPV